ncbi:MAG: hypothetical protein WAV55_02305 [Clostridiaceae bacterium]
MSYKLIVEINTERPIAALADNDKLKGLAQYLEDQGFVMPGSIEIDATTGRAKVKATDQLIQYIEKYLG